MHRLARGAGVMRDDRLIVVLLIAAAIMLFVGLFKALI
jgi:hypothetical protein